LGALPLVITLSERLNSQCYGPPGQRLDITALMSRHRAPSRSRHSAQQRGMPPGCCARFHAPLARVASGVFLVAAARVRRVAAHSEYRRAVRGAFLAPWFAVSLGIVIAASLSLAAPRAALSFPPAKGHCRTAGCSGPQHKTGRATSGPTAAVNRQPTSREPKSRGDASGRSVVVRYRLMMQRRGKFMAMIQISGRRPLGNWRLRFSLPDARIRSIMWGQWAAGGAGSVTVYGSPSPWPRSSPGRVRIVVSGVGAPQWPRRCAYDRVRCVFRRLGRR